MSGDFDVQAQVTSVENTNGDAKGGIVARGSLDGNAAHAYVLPR